jgi:predicted anti-sigma-YlaC factor YlaD
MTKLNCESVCMAAMAMADGYESEVSSEQIEAHLSDCPDCRRELGQLRTLASLLVGQKRRQRAEHIWTDIEGYLPDVALAQNASRTWRPLALLCLLLLGYKLVEMIPERDLGLLFKLVPVLFIVAAFGYLKENPFKLNAALRLEDGE